MLSQRYPIDTLRPLLHPREEFHPYPTAGERGPWEALPESLREAYVRRGAAALEFGWPVLTAARFLEFVREGNRTRYQAERNARRGALARLVLAECVEAEGRFVDQIVNGVWATCEETYWGVPAHLRLQSAGRGLPDIGEPTVDLFAAETSSLLAWTLYLVGEQMDDVSPLVRPRLHSEIGRRILTPLLERDDFSWMGFHNPARRVNNWNPWINSNWLTSFLLMEEDPERRLAGVARSLCCLDNFIDPYPEDGGCDEGPGYWGRAAASLFECLELLEVATGGEIDLFDEPLLRNMGSFIYRVHIADSYFVNFADASALLSPVAPLVYRYGKRVGDPALAGFGAWLSSRRPATERGFADSLGRQLPALMGLGELLEAPASVPLPRDAWFSEIQVMTARCAEGSTEGLFLAAKGGTNNESHNHNDIGNFVVYVGGKPLVIDTGVEPYTAKNSGPERYDIWTMSSAYHNLPVVDGHVQQPGSQCAAEDVHYVCSDTSAVLSLDIASVYPAEAGIRSWVRKLSLNRGESVEITDTFALEGPPKEGLALSLMTPCEVVDESPGTLRLKETPLAADRVSGSATVTYNDATFDATTEEISLEGGERLHTVWGPRVVRITLTAKAPGQTGEWAVRITP